MFSFGTQEQAYKALLGAVNGDVFDVEVTKNAQGYNDWVSAKKSDGSAPPATAAGTSATATTKSYAPSSGGGSSYPTAEERAKTQIYIVRQSNITAAINVLSVGAKTPPKIADIISTAKYFEDHVFGNSNDTVVDAKPARTVSAFDDLDNMDDVPL